MTRPRPNWKTLRATLWERAEGRCEVSGVPLDPDTFDAHHRRPKGSGGTSRENTDLVTNLLALDPQAHNGGPGSVHGERIWALENGYLIPKHEPEPRLFPVLWRGQRWVWLLPDGGTLDM